MTPEHALFWYAVVPTVGAFGLFISVAGIRHLWSLRRSASGTIETAPTCPADTTPSLETALPIIQFAVANLPPETTVGWPYTDLKAVAAKLRADDRFDNPDLLLDFDKFADECANYDRHRRANPPAVTRAVASDFGPKTQEAAVIDGLAAKTIQSVPEAIEAAASISDPAQGSYGAPTPAP